MASPLEQFTIRRYAEFSVGGIDVSFTNAALFMLLGLLAVWLFMFMGMRRAALVPNRWQAAVEGVHEFIVGLIDENIGPKGRPFAPFLFSLFMFILALNLIGLLPWGYTVTSHIAVTLAMALFIFAMCLVIGFARHGFHFFTLFMPPKTPAPLLVVLVPIEIISYLSRPLTLSVRLFANMTAGHILLKVFAGFIISLGLTGSALMVIGVLPLMMNVALYALELLVAVVQAYVFTLLTCVYLNDSVNLSH